jgi:dipeptidyl aminopeptidase/acylaminoacyl peptidase
MEICSMRSARSILLILCVTLGLMMIHTTETAAARPQRPTEWTLEDLLHTENAEAWDVAPDGSAAVWVRSTIAKVKGEEKGISNLWLSPLTTPEGSGGRSDDRDSEQDPSFALTRGQHSVASPVFSPDGQHIAFLSNRPLPEVDGEDGDDLGDRQLWVLPLRGGEAYPITRFDRDIQHFDWRDARTLVVAAQESPTAWERQRKKQKDKAVVVDDLDHEPPVRLFTVTLDGEARRLSHNGDWIDTLAVAPDGRRAVVQAQQNLRYEFDQKVPPKTYLADLETGAFTVLYEGREIIPFNVHWQADSTGFYFANERTNDPFYRVATVRDLYHHDLASGKSRRVDLGSATLGGEFTPVAGGVVALVENGVRYRTLFLRTEGTGWRATELAGEHAGRIDDLVANPDGTTVIYRHTTAATPPQWFASQLEGDRLEAVRPLTRLNPKFADKPTGRVEIIRWQGAQGHEVEGLLHYPLDWSDNATDRARRPLVVDIHGGPNAKDRDSWDQRWSGPLLLWRQRGAFVLQVNYHGSAGYGLEWVESIKDHYYDFEPIDILNGVDQLIEQGLVDPDRLGCTGWSNGGILTADLITRTTRFKAAAVGAGDVEWVSDWANVDFGASFDNYYFGGPPWEKLDTYLEKSPFFRLAKVETPTIVFTGTEDRAVPPHQSWSLFRALQYLEKTPVRLVLFPGEPHGLRKIAHQRRKAEEELAWFDRYLFEAKDTKNAAVKDGSRLQALLRQQRAARVGTAFGQNADGKLIPEVVPYGALKVGRFEVTRAQWAAFDADFSVRPGTENHPVTGVSFERAKAYAAWLAERTGRPFRLPTVKERKQLGSGGGGNTLDHWAGYSPNPDDAARLREALQQLPGEAPLLLPVGSFPGQGDDPLFDLDGNAAEWAVGEDGQGQVIGPSADRAVDERMEGGTDDEAYVGLRVVE